MASAAVLYVFRTLVDDDIPLNDGCLRPLTLVVPEGSMLAPTYPAAVVAGNVETSQAVTGALYAALGVQAEGSGTMNNVTFGNADHQYYETIASGSGAGDGFDGAPAVQTHMTNSRLTDPEVLETRFPVRVESFSIRHGSGGAGRWRGGDGGVRRLVFDEPMTISVLSGHRRLAPYGMAGGEPGALGRTWVERSDGTRDSAGECRQHRCRRRRRARGRDARWRRLRRCLVRRSLLLWAALALAVFTGVAVLVATEPAWFVDADQHVSASTQATAAGSPWVSTLAQAVTLLGSGWVALALVLAVGGALLVARRPFLAFWLAAAVGGSALLNTVVKAGVQRDRPDYPGTVIDPLGSSFPSGHSQSVVVTWVSVLLVVGWATVLAGQAARVASVLFVVLAVAAVGWSRVAMGVHWPSDVLGGWSLGSAWVLAATAALLGVPSRRADDP